LLYGSENWTIKARDATRVTAADMKYMRITAAQMQYMRITAAQMQYMRITAGYTWTDHKINKEIAKDSNITPVLDKIQDYKRKWIQHVNRMVRNRLHRLMKNYIPKGRRSQGRPLKRLLGVRDRNGSTSGRNP
jgi:hypothetical protein